MISIRQRAKMIRVVYQDAQPDFDPAYQDGASAGASYEWLKAWAREREIPFSDWPPKMASMQVRYRTCPRIIRIRAGTIAAGSPM